jgi:hypothetical protein
MTWAPALATAITFVWLGMVLAISFVEAPLKFRAAGVTLHIGLGIGRLVFRALNTAEAVLASALLISIMAAGASAGITVIATVAVTLLVLQVAVVRPRLTRRSDLILSGEHAPRSRSHYAYVTLEAVKVVALIVTGSLLLAL